MQYFEDLEIGVTRESGTKLVDQREVIDFALEFDPQPFHIDPEAAKCSIFGGLIASGWHTGSMMMRLIVDSFTADVSSIGSPGFDELRWLKPVRPGDVIRVRSTCIDKAPHERRPNLGICRFRNEVVNQTGEVVMSVLAIVMYNRRPNNV